MDLKIPVKTTAEDKFLKLLEVLKLIAPFNQLRPRERQVYAELLYYNEKYKALPEKDRNALIFGYNTKESIALKYKISKDVVYNLMKELKHKGLITGREINKELIEFNDGKWALADIKSITFKFL